MRCCASSSPGLTLIYEQRRNFWRLFSVIVPLPPRSVGYRERRATAWIGALIQARDPEGYGGASHPRPPH